MQFYLERELISEKQVTGNALRNINMKLKIPSIKELRGHLKDPL